MKKITVSAMAMIIALGSALPGIAQQTETRLEGETAMQMATRVGACDRARITDAEFVNGGTALSVTCSPRVAANNTGGGLGTGGLLAAGVGIAAVIGIAASSSSSSGTN